MDKLPLTRYSTRKVSSFINGQASEAAGWLNQEKADCDSMGASARWVFRKICSYKDLDIRILRCHHYSQFWTLSCCVFQPFAQVAVFPASSHQIFSIPSYNTQKRTRITSF
jgi:hypothetical protein